MSFGIWILFCLSGSALSCGCRGYYKVHTQHFTNEHVTVSIPGLPSHPTGMVRDNQWMPQTTYEGHKKFACQNLRPGLEHFNHGVNKYWFSCNDTDMPPAVGYLFEYNCSYTRKDGKYDLPLQIHSILTYPKTVMCESISTFHGISDILVSKAREILDFWYIYVKKKISWSETSKSFEGSTTVASYVVNRYSSLLFGDVVPSDNIQNAYDGLPIIYIGNELAYQRMIFLYGTHFYRDINLGGRWFLVLKHKKGGQETFVRTAKASTVAAVTVSELVQELESATNSTATSKFVLSRGGSLSFNASLDDWARTVIEDPTPVTGTLVGLPYLLDAKADFSQKATSFFQAIESEEVHHGLKKILLQLEHAQAHNIYHPVLLKVVENEIRYVRPRKHLFDILQEPSTQDFEFGIYWIECKKKNTLSDEYCEAYDVRERYHLVEGICVTKASFFSECEWLEWKHPNGNACLKMFPKPNCIGAGTKVTSLEKIKELFHLSTSIMFC